MVTDRHSLTVFDIDGSHLTMTQIDQCGQEIDRIRVAKGAGDEGEPTACTPSRWPAG